MSNNTDEQDFVCESLNINAILNARSGPCFLSEVCVLSICGGKNDIFTKTVIDWLQKTKNLTAINLLLCGANKNVDSLLAKMRKLETTPEDLTKMTTRKKKTISDSSEPKLYMKHQNNLPSEAQWQVLQPDIVVVGLHCLSERWCTKNAPFEILFPVSTTNQEEAGSQSLSSSIDEESDDSGDESNEHVGQKRKQKFTDEIYVETSRRPTLFRTEICRRIMLLHCLSLVAKHRPRIIFFQNITEPSKQTERRRKEELLWSYMVSIMQHFCVECAYRIRPMGLELKEKQSDDYPTCDIWCNAVFLERIDNEVCHSTLHHDMCLYESPESIANIQEATKWIFYDQKIETNKNFGDVFNVKQSVYCVVPNKVDESERQASNVAKKRRKKSVTLPVKCCFPFSFAKALAHYAVAQIVSALSFQ